MPERTSGVGIAGVRPGQRCSYDVLVKQADVKVTGTGKTFINAVVEDVTGRIECVQWDPDDQTVDAYTNHDVIQIRGTCGTYKDKPQITVEVAVAQPANQIDWKHVLASSPVNFEWMCDLRKSMIERIRAGCRRGVSEPLAAIVDVLTSTTEFMHTPAATFMHHAYLHGLLEHSLSVTMNAIKYTGVGEARSGGWDLDVVLAGSMLHDVGKINEYTMTGKRMPVSKTLGHSLMGCEMFAQAVMTTIVRGVEAHESLDPEIVNQVKHVIAAHHGRQEWGAVVEPQTSEAWLVHCMDLADSRMFATSKRVV